MRKNESPYRLSGLFGHYSRQEITDNLTPRAAYLKMRGSRTDTLKTKTSTKQAEKETERKCLRQKKAKKEAEHNSLWQNYKERRNNTNARVK